MGWVEQGGAFAFGLVIGWILYFVNRYRADKIGIRDLGALIGAIGGGAVTALFPEGGRLFGWYSIGLAVGFFAYLILLFVLVGISEGFSIDFFLDGRAPALAKGQKKTEQRALGGAPLTGDREDESEE